MRPFGTRRLPHARADRPAGGHGGVSFAVRVKLDDAKLASSLPAGTAGDAAIFTEHVKPSHIIRMVILRQIAILNYVNPF